MSASSSHGGDRRRRTVAGAVCFAVVVLLISNATMMLEYNYPAGSVAAQTEVLHLLQQAITGNSKPAPKEGQQGQETQPHQQFAAESNTVESITGPKSIGYREHYAYAWVIGAIDKDRPAYKGFLYDVLVSAHLLRKLGSEADFWILAQLSHNATGNDLPAEDVRMLKALGFHIKILDKPVKSSFAHLVYEKFHPLQFTQYRRIMFLDADILPLINMDYLFHLSDPEHKESPTILRPNLILATRGEPCNTGMFIMHPEPGAWEELERIVDRQHQIGQKLPYPHFSWQDGWGHNFNKEGDSWEAIKRNGTMWRYHAGHSDQGLWYYFQKYVHQDVSIVIGNRIQNISPGPDGKPQKENFVDILSEHSPTPIADQYECMTGKRTSPMAHVCNPVYRDFAHFMGQKKPWFKLPCKVCGAKDLHQPHHRWFEELAELNQEHSMGLDMENFAEKHIPHMKESPLGYKAEYRDHMEKVMSHGKLENRSDAAAVDNKIQADPPKVSPSQPGSDPLTVAYAVSFIKCGNFQSHAAGLTDASLILRHSIHKISRRNPESGSKYDYKMYAIVHKAAEDCSRVLKETGFEVLVVEPPVKQQEIRGESLRKGIHKEFCCGADEFIKLFAYSLPEELVVHVDIDFAFYKPMDELFDAIRFDKDSPEGRVAREKLLLERPTDKLPDKIDAFITRDWPQVAPNKWPAGYQAGFLVARRDPSVLEEMVEVIREGNYTQGWGWKFGWGNLGYGGWIGAMAMQGLVAYYYDHIRPNTAVELNHCRFNHMGMDVLYRHQPNFRKNVPGVGGCRNGAGECEDCMTTEMEKIHSVHYTMCRKPWQCIGIGVPGGKAPGQGRATAINTDMVNLDHCLGLIKHWHALRTDFENQLYRLTKDETIKPKANETYMPEIFQGHCDGDGNKHYRLISGTKESFRRVQELYT